ncbi:hypothetical protein L7F22_034954 [Adiantum nelumboides]|nr:hypothetical protein [Adiantum nelumboides]
MRLYKIKQLVSAVDNFVVNLPDSGKDYAELLQACIALKAIEEGRRVYTQLTFLGNEKYTSIGNKIINMYIKCGTMIDARDVFHRLRNLDVISWTSLIGGYAHHGLGDEAFKILQQMKREGVSPNRVTFLCILDALDSIADSSSKGQMVHTEVVDSAVDADIMIATALVNMYNKAGSIEDACKVFQSTAIPDAILCTAMINAFNQHGQEREALQLFGQMVCEGTEPNEYTFTSILSVCASLADLMQGQKVHIFIEFTNKEIGFVGAALVNMYAKCGRLHQAHFAFERLGERTLTSWTALITGYAYNGYSEAAIELFQQMQVDGLEADVVVGNVLIDLFSKCGNLIDARRIFDNMSMKDIVSWSALISGYAQQGLGNDALELYCQMLRENVLPDEYTLSSVLGACANLTALIEGMKVHLYIVDVELDSDTVIKNTLVNFYAQCGSMREANAAFNLLLNPEVRSWNAMILGYGQHGYGKAAYDVFETFLGTTSKPDEYTFSGILSACASFGMLAEGKEVRKHITRVGFETNIVVCNALIDMYAACGNLKEAMAVFSSMMDRDLISWSSMVGGWAQHGYGKEALSLFQQMQLEGFKPDELTLSSILIGCSYAGLVEEGCFCFVLMAIIHKNVLTLEHYISVVDLLGRSGRLYEATEYIYKMPIQPTCMVWITLLAACHRRDNVQLADYAAKYAFDFGPRSSSAYILLSNVYVVADA